MNAYAYEMLSKYVCFNANQTLNAVRSTCKTAFNSVIMHTTDNPVTLISKSTVNNNKCGNVFLSCREENYKVAITTLNNLQSNNDSIRQSIALNKQGSLDDTNKYLHRSGLSLMDLEKLSVIHVSGTKGKGSTCALTESILRTHGLKTGFFSSPHILHVTERIKINGKSISKSNFVRIFWRVYLRLQAAKQYDDDMPAYFKFLTILSFHVFLEENVDVVILEVGIGGEFDATNIIRHTKTVGITSLGLEHTQLLGNSLTQIAWQKAGIIKQYSRVYTSVSQPECLEIIKERAVEKKSIVQLVPQFSSYTFDAKWQSVIRNLNDVTQLNGSLAVQLAFDWLLTQDITGVIKRNKDQNYLTQKFVKGLSDCNWPGRCQIFRLNNFIFYFDGAHTTDSMYFCSNWFQKRTQNSSNPKVLIFNSTGDRDGREFLNILRLQNKFEFACFVPNVPSKSMKNMDSESAINSIRDQISRAKNHLNHWVLFRTDKEQSLDARLFHTILDCLNFLQMKFINNHEIDILVTGSLHLIGATTVAVREITSKMKKT